MQVGAPEMAMQQGRRARTRFKQFRRQKGHRLLSTASRRAIWRSYAGDLQFSNQRVEAGWRFRLGHLGGISSLSLRGTYTGRKCVVPMGMDLSD